MVMIAATKISLIISLVLLPNNCLGLVSFFREREQLRYYFAYGSNMLQPTLTSLRNVQPINATAAVLPGYKLCFNIPGNDLIEPSAACVEPATESDCSVHGVLYTLRESDFRTVSRTEGVPVVYQWQDVKVFPYSGNGESAGVSALQDDTPSVYAQTLVSSFRGADIPPSPSYLRILQDGAAYWRMDEDYQKLLRQTPVADQLLVPGGVSGPLLDIAMLLNPSKSP